MQRDWPTTTITRQTCSIHRSDGPCSSLIRDEDDTAELVEAPVEVTISKTEEFDEVGPATYQIAFHNGWDRTLVVEFGITPPFNRYGGSDESGNVVKLYPLEADDAQFETDAVVPSRPRDGVWRARDSVTIPDLGVLELVEPGEAVERDYALLAPAERDETELGPGAPNAGEGFVEGTYRFRQKCCLSDEEYDGIDLPELDLFILFEFEITVELP